MNRASAPRLNLFKLIVSFILVAILLLMLLRGCATNPAQNMLSPAMTETLLVPNPTETSTTLPDFTETVSATETLVPSPLPPTDAAASNKAVSLETSTPPSNKSTPTVSPDLTSTLAVTKTAATGATPASGEGASCTTSAPSRLSVGQRARVILRLNMRSDASITAPLLQTNPANTEVEIIGGPVCTPVGKRAYLWWQIRLPDSAEGWSAEMQLNQPSYFLEPIS